MNRNRHHPWNIIIRGVLISVLVFLIIIILSVMDANAQGLGFEDWVINNSQQSFTLNFNHPVTAEGIGNGWYPVGPLTTETFSVGDFERDVHLQRFQATNNVIWTCYQMQGAPRVNCIPHQATNSFTNWR